MLDEDRRMPEKPSRGKKTTNLQHGDASVKAEHQQLLFVKDCELMLIFSANKPDGLILKAFVCVPKELQHVDFR